MTASPSGTPDDDGQAPSWARLFEQGGSFILDAPSLPMSVWGHGAGVLWSSGEALMIAALQGLGKSTLAQQLALGRAGVPEFAEVLGLPVTPGRGRVLYLAMDRPSQIRRSFRRMVGESWRDELDRSLAIWPGPPPMDLARNPGLLASMCAEVRADTVIVDSLKDAAAKLVDDETGALWNRARQLALRAGVEVIELHHNRKQPAGAKAEAPTVDDVYGSTWLTSGCGSIILLTGAPGDPIVRLHHVKQPAEQVGPLTIAHDHEAGVSSVWHAADLVEVARVRGPLSARDAAACLFDTEKPSAADKEKARRRLDALVRAGHLTVVDEGDKGSNRPRLWGPK
jgi:replicative DNA helicase